MGKLTGIEFKVVGVTFDNDDTGINRQVILSTMNPSSKIELVREPTNKYDINAIAVRHQGANIGYVGKQFVKVLAPLIDQGRKFTAHIKELDKYNGTYYCKIVVDEI